MRERGSPCDAQDSVHEGGGNVEHRHPTDQDKQESIFTGHSRCLLI